MQTYLDFVAEVGPSQAAKIIGVSEAMISHWKMGRKRFCPDRAVDIERRTKGRVSALDICPEIMKFQSIGMS